MGQYNRLPHLLTQPVTNPKKAANALGVGGEGDGAALRPAVRGRLPRHHRLQRGVRPGRAAPPSRSASRPSTYERLPYIVVVVDELNDLMMVAARDVEESITRIAQKARAVGIHLIVATQRPSSTSSPASSRPTSRPAWRSPCRASPTAGSSSTSPAPRSWSARATCCCCPATPASPQRIQGSLRQRGGGAQGRRPLAAPGARGRRTSSGVEGDDDGAGGGRRLRRQRSATTTRTRCCCARRWSWSCAASSARRRCCSAS